MNSKGQVLCHHDTGARDVRQPALGRARVTRLGVRRLLSGLPMAVLHGVIRDGPGGPGGVPTPEDRRCVLSVRLGLQASLSVTLMTDASLPQTQPEGADNDQAPCAVSVRRKVSVKGSGGVSATVVVTVRRGRVWLSIQPPFTWEAIMEPGKVDELTRTLTLAREDAQRMVRDKRVPRGGK